MEKPKTFTTLSLARLYRDKQKNLAQMQENLTILSNTEVENRLKNKHSATLSQASNRHSNESIKLTDGANSRIPLNQIDVYSMNTIESDIFGNKKISQKIIKRNHMRIARAEKKAKKKREAGCANDTS
jgi:hypothetical protein